MSVWLDISVEGHISYYKVSINCLNLAQIYVLVVANNTSRLIGQLRPKSQPTNENPPNSEGGKKTRKWDKEKIKQAYVNNTSALSNATVSGAKMYLYWIYYSANQTPLSSSSLV